MNKMNTEILDLTKNLSYFAQKINTKVKQALEVELNNRASPNVIDSYGKIGIAIDNINYCLELIEEDIKKI